MNDNVVVDKSLDFALRIVKLCHYLNEAKREFVLSKELLISGTNIGKHVKAAVGAENRDVFISEFGIARRRALETEYWLLVLFHGDLNRGRISLDRRRSARACKDYLIDHFDF